LPGGRARDQKIGHIRARDQKAPADDRHQHTKDSKTDRAHWELPVAAGNSSTHILRSAQSKSEKQFQMPFPDLHFEHLMEERLRPALAVGSLLPASCAQKTFTNVRGAFQVIEGELNRSASSMTQESESVGRGWIHSIESGLAHTTTVTDIRCHQLLAITPVPCKSRLPETWLSTA